MVIVEAPHCPPSLFPLRAGCALATADYQHIRRQMALHFCKWDPQVADTSTLAPFPLFLPRSQWNALAILSEKLAAELTAAERELLSRPDLYRQLGLPRAFCRLLDRAGVLRLTPSAA